MSDNHVTQILEDLRSENLLLKETINVLKKEVEIYKAANEKLTIQINHLQDKLGLNSTNSSLPPSRDLYKKLKAEKKKSDRPRGAQIGHKGMTRDLLPLEKVNHVIKCHPDALCECGGEITNNEGVEPLRHQVFELPEIKPIVTEYQIYSGKCNKCKQVQHGELPNGVANNILGHRAMAFIAEMVTTYHCSKRKIQKFFNEQLGIQISLGTVSNAEKRLNLYLTSCYESLANAIKEQTHLNIDETGHRQENKRGYVWIFCNDKLTLLKAKMSRGKKVLIETLGDFKGSITSDRYGAYNYIVTDKRQSCWSHLIRDFKRFSHSNYPKVAEIGSELLTQGEDFFALRNKLKLGEISLETFSNSTLPIQARMEELLRSGTLMVDAKQFSNSCKNIIKLYKTMWLCTKHDNVEPTNNLAERQLRQYVIWRKMSFGTQSDRGSEYIAKSMSISATCRQSGISAFETFTGLISNAILGTPKTIQNYLPL